MKLHCKECGAEIPSENINIDRLVAKCTECNTVFCFADSVNASDRPGSSAIGTWSGQAFSRHRLDMPPGLEIVDTGKSLIIKAKWWQNVYLFFVFFCLFWDCFMIAWFTFSILSGAWPMACFGVFHAAIGIALTYYTVCCFFNTTVISVKNGLISVDFTPLPWPGSCSIPVAQVEQLFSKEKVTYGKNGPNFQYSVQVVLPGGSGRKTLVRGLDTAEQALYIEQQIEKFLDIEDRPVPGEIARA